MSVWQHIHSSRIKPRYLGSLCKILGICPLCSVLNLALLVLKFLLTLLENLVCHYICVWVCFSWAWVKQSGAFLVHINFFFVDFKALLSLKFIFTAICDKKMMIIDAFSTTNPAFITFICYEGLFRGNKKKQFWNAVCTALQCSRLKWKPNGLLKFWVALV